MTGRSPYWRGMLCTETRDEIAERMRGVLDGQWFTLVTCNSFDETSERFLAVDVYPSQYLTAPVENYRASDVCGLSWSTPRLSMGVHTRAATQAAAREGRPHDYAQFVFEPDEVVVHHYAPAGYRLRWSFTVERRETEMAGAPGAEV